MILVIALIWVAMEKRNFVICNQGVTSSNLVAGTSVFNKFDAFGKDNSVQYVTRQAYAPLPAQRRDREIEAIMVSSAGMRPSSINIAMPCTIDQA
ncbi:MAG: hypothetical protein RIS52_1772 [Pseudomonadota bacterium]